jgi:predicted RNA binding protein YcfA (HicA-like mRNA interferase family)
VSPALSDLPIRKIISVIESLGFVHVRTKGSHAVYQHPDGRAVVIPQHGTIKRGTWLNPAASWYHPYRISRTAPLTTMRGQSTLGTATQQSTERKTADNQPRHTSAGALPTTRSTAKTLAAQPAHWVTTSLVTTSVTTVIRIPSRPGLSVADAARPYHSGRTDQLGSASKCLLWSPWRTPRQLRSSTKRDIHLWLFMNSGRAPELIASSSAKR